MLSACVSGGVFADRSSVAPHARLVGAVAGLALLLTAFDVASALASALGVNRLMASLLFGVEPTDVPTMAAVVAPITFAAVASLAARLARVAAGSDRSASRCNVSRLPMAARIQAG